MKNLPRILIGLFVMFMAVFFIAAVGDIRKSVMTDNSGNVQNTPLTFSNQVAMTVAATQNQQLVRYQEFTNSINSISTNAFVSTNNSVFLNAITNVSSTGTGTGLVSSVSNRIALLKSIIPGTNISITDSGGTNLTISVTGISSGGGDVFTASNNTYSVNSTNIFPRFVLIGTLNVTNSSAFAGTSTMTNLTVLGTSSLSGANISGTAQVTNFVVLGTSSLSGANVSGTLISTNLVVLGNTTNRGEVVNGSLTVTNGATIAATTTLTNILINGTFTLKPSASNGFVLTSDGSGVGTWQAAGAGSQTLSRTTSTNAFTFTTAGTRVWTNIFTLTTSATNGTVVVDARVLGPETFSGTLYIRLRDASNTVNKAILSSGTGTGGLPLGLTLSDKLTGTTKTYLMDVSSSTAGTVLTNYLANGIDSGQILTNSLGMVLQEIP